MQYLIKLPLLVAAASPCLAQEAGREADYELITTAIHSRRAETALPVTVLSGDELRNQARASIGETLANQPGINNASFGPGVGQPVIRGQQGRRVLNLENGIPNADASGNSADHAIATEPLLADAVEVLRGPSTLLYGGGAIGGVVNVIDHRIPDAIPEQPGFALEVRHDTAADLNVAVGRADFASGGIVWHVDALRREWNNLEIPGLAIDPRYIHEEHAHEEGEDHGEDRPPEENHAEAAAGLENSDGYVDNTSGDTSTGTLGGSYVFDSGFIGLSVNHLISRYGIPPGLHAHGTEPETEHEEGESATEHEEHGALRIDMQRTRYDLAGQWQMANPYLENLRYQLSYTDYAHREIEGHGVLANRFSNESWQQRLQLTHAPFLGWHGVLGWQSSLGEFAAAGQERFIPRSRNRSNGIFLVEDYHFSTLTLELGARYNRDELEPRDMAAPARDFSTRSFSASGLWDISSPLTLGLTWSHSQRPPSVEELYSNHELAEVEDCVIHGANAACEVGDDSFSAETSRNMDLSLYLDLGWLSAALTAFHNDFEDFIFLADTGARVDGFPIRHYRQTDARFHGLELEATVHLTPRLDGRLFGDLVDGELDREGAAPRMPPARLGAQLSYSGESWSAFISVLHAHAQDEPGQHELPTAAYTRWDIGADYTLDMGNAGQVQIFATARNLGDEEIRLATSFLRGFAPEAGRSLELGLRYRF